MRPPHLVKVVSGGSSGDARESKLLVKCGRDVSKGKCAGMKGKKPNPKPSVEEPKVGESSKKGEKGVYSEKADKGESSKKSKNGWLDGCRRVIGLDGCFLTHTCKGQLLTAMGRDANNQMFPIAWAVVSVENKNNWCWFLSLLHEDLSLGIGSGLKVISDAHKGSIEAVASWFPNAEHRQFWLVFPSAFQEVEVRRGDEAYEVNLNTRKCSCRMWELSGIPCVHAIAAYTHMKMEPELGVSQFYSKNKWLEAYQHSIRPVPGSKLWKPVDFPKPLPPIERKMPRRPRKVRIRHPTENDHEISRRRRVMHCHKCWEVGHNKSPCTNPKIPKPSPSTAADGGTETLVPKPTSLKTATAAKTGPPSSPPVMPPEGPPEPRSSVVGRGKCQLKPINKLGVGNIMAKNHGKATINKNQGKASGAVKKGTGVRIGSPIRMGSTTATRLSEQEYQKEMDYEALAAVEAEQATKDAE
ncbi:zinc finger, PMZ-type containing protein [Tanacetum coccineum]|uniref:Zinc finger, PMZ-type containing protein n=1 Tax=Tanacetum coccineum TaxID=301880 RepID=A0ABQ5E981_9ASTR